MNDLLIMQIECCRNLVSCRNSVILKGYGASDNVTAWHGSLDVMTGQFDWLYALNPSSFLCLWCGCLSASPSPLSCVPWTLIPPLFRWLLW